MVPPGLVRQNVAKEVATMRAVNELFWVLMSAGVAVACGSAGSEPTRTSEAAGTVGAALGAMRGHSERDAALPGTRHMRAHGEHHDRLFGANPNQDCVRSEFSYEKTWRPSTGETTTSWKNLIHKQPLAPEYDTTLTYTETYNATAGSVKGVDSFVTGPTGPMFPSRIAATGKRDRFEDPELLLADAMKRPMRHAGREGRYEFVEVDAAEGDLAPTLLTFDRHSHELVKASTFEDDPHYGDAGVEMEYGDWREVSSAAGSMRVPFHLVWSVGGHASDIEDREAFEIDAPVADDVFAVAPGTAPDAERAAAGERSSEWFVRSQLNGWPSFKDISKSVVLTDVAPGIVLVGGGSHNSVAVEMTDHLILIEAPNYEKRSLAVIDALDRRFPNKPVTRVINTQYHFDHSGGLRTYVARGAAITTAAINERFFRRVFEAPHTLVADELERHPRAWMIDPVYDEAWIGDESQKLYVFEIPNVHELGMLGVYLPEAKLVVEADLYNPFGAAKKALGGDGGEMARELLDAIAARNLEVDRVIGIHGGIGTLADVKVAAGR
jgi:glyoxylase-like metal-dependent hydrolase (beta-lactamase superfamily II)